MWIINQKNFKQISREFLMHFQKIARINSSFKEKSQTKTLTNSKQILKVQKKCIRISIIFFLIYVDFHCLYQLLVHAEKYE